MAPEYSRDQLSQFLAHINIPAEFRLDRDPRPDLAFLTALHVHMISAVPFENLALHYSKTRRISVDPQFLFSKIVTGGRGRGGYCLENGILLMNVLRGLGFDVYPVAARVRYRVNGVPQGGFQGWVHFVNIVTLPDLSRWAVDVGFGGDGMTQPLALADDAIIRNMGTQDARLIQDFIPGQTVLSPGRRLWIYQVRNGADKPWTSNFCFSDMVEWLQQDFDTVNHFTGHCQESFMTQTVLAVRFLRRKGDNGDEEIYGKRMLVDGLVKENLGGKTEVVQECKTEEDRIEALKKWFGIELTEEERDSMKGHLTEIKG